MPVFVSLIVCPPFFGAGFVGVFFFGPPHFFRALFFDWSAGWWAGVVPLLLSPRFSRFGGYWLMKF